MNRSRDNRSRFGPQTSYGGSNALPLLSLKTGKPRNFDDGLFSSQSYQSSSFKTPEQLAFDKEFEKWEKSFDDWKMAYANHPDRQAYREYERKFLDVREKLLEKRKQIYGDELGGRGFLAPFDNQLIAADAMANSILSKFEEPRDFRDDDRYRGGYGRSNDRWNSGDRDRSDGRGRDRSDGRGRDRSDGRGRDISDGRGRNDGRRDSGGRAGQSHVRRDSGGRGGFGNDRNNRGGRGNDRDFGRRDGRMTERRDRPMPKPTPEQLEKELARRDIYPNNRWILCSKEERPALVGKRAKKKNTKIQNVIERKRKIAAGEIPLEELPLIERIDKMFEIAKETECPKLLPGSAQRKLKNARKKNEEDWTIEERKLVAYYDFVIAKRAKYFQEEAAKKEAAANETDEAPKTNETETPMETERTPA